MVILKIRATLVKSYLYSGDYKGTIKAIEELTGIDTQTEKSIKKFCFIRNRTL